MKCLAHQIGAAVVDGKATRIADANLNGCAPRHGDEPNPVEPPAGSEPKCGSREASSGRAKKDDAAGCPRRLSPILT